MAIKAIINNTEKEIEQIKNSDEQDIDYVYSRIGDTEVEGEPPISIKSIGGNLADYRIYGNTVSGESVGDRTGNLFDGEFLQGYWVSPDGHFTESNAWICTQKIPCKANTDYTFTFSNKSRWYGIAWYDIAGNYIRFSFSDSMSSQPTILTATSPANAAFMGIDIADDSVSHYIHPSDVTDFMLVEGSTPLPYEPYGYKLPVTVSNGTDTLITPIYLPEQIRKIGDEAEYIDYGEQKQHRVRKNLLQNTATSQTRGRDESDPETYPGVTFTVNDDKSVTCNGASNQTTYIYLCMDFIPEEGITYLYSGCPQNGDIMSYELDLINLSGIIKQDIGNGITFDSTSRDGYLRVRLRIGAGYTCNNLTFYPMIRKADIEDDTYEPYIENTDLDVTLPALSTIKGTNTFSVNTSIQPSNIYIKDSFDYKKVFTATRTIEDELPLNYRNIEDNDSTLDNYRIYGNTVDGESVGDRTANLFDENDVVTNILITSDGTMNIGDNGDKFIYNRINVLPNITYTFSWQQMILGTANNTPYIRVSSYDANNNFLARDLMQVDVYPNKTCSITTRNNAAFWDIRIDDASSKRGQHLEEVMLNAGSDALPYEPYGYKVPVTVSNGTDTQTIPIYLPEPIKMVGDEAEYIDFGQQKQHRVRKNLFDKSHFIQSNLVFRLDSTYILADPYTVSTILPCKPNTKYTITKIITNRFIIWGCENYPVAGENGNGRIVQDDNAASLTFTTGSNDNFLLVMLFYRRQPSDPTVEDVKNNLMYNYGEMCPYEPYIENTDIDVTLPALPTLPGTNVLSVGTAVQPSGVYIKGKIKEIN